MQPNLPGPEQTPGFSPRRRSAASIALAMLCLGCALQSAPEPGVGQEQPAPAEAGVHAPPTGDPGAAVAPSQSPPAKQLSAEADEPARQPATVAEAAAAIDLSTLPLLAGADKPNALAVARLSYAAPGDVKGAFEFHRRTLLDRQWKELSHPQIYDQSASGQFSKNGFHVSLSVSSGSEAGKVAVQLMNHSNVNLARLPVPAGSTLQYSFPGVASFVTSAPPDETAAAVRKLLMEQGWQPYGAAGDWQHFKQNAVELRARVFAPPAQPGKTTIDYSASQLSADLPAPADAEHVQYADPIKRLDVDAPGAPDDLAAYYKTALAPAGWKNTTDNPVKDGFEFFMIFRNPAKDMLTLTMRQLEEEKKTRLSLVHQSAAEGAEVEQRIQLAMEAKKKKAEDDRTRPMPKVEIALPRGAAEVKASAREIVFHLASGSAKAAVDDIGRQLSRAGWQAEEPVGESAAGQISWKKGEQAVTIVYVDPGFIPAEITITAQDVQLEPAAKK